ncbi:Metalloprotease TIKI1-like protein [Aphelenchoides besseyi]|nr:Metalloprotease TIKI1-like protein [Aphelenchoides besseyi]
MKLRFLNLLTLWSLFLIVQSSSEECDLNQNERSTFLWSVTRPNDDSQNFLFGTIHVAYDRVWDSVLLSVKNCE